MRSYLPILLVLADWPLVYCALAVAIVDSLADRVSGTPRYVSLYHKLAWYNVCVTSEQKDTKKLAKSKQN